MKLGSTAGDHHKKPQNARRENQPQKPKRVTLRTKSFVGSKHTHTPHRHRACQSHPLGISVQNSTSQKFPERAHPCSGAGQASKETLNIAILVCSALSLYLSFTQVSLSLSLHEHRWVIGMLEVLMWWNLLRSQKPWHFLDPSPAVERRDVQ